MEPVVEIENEKAVETIPDMDVWVLMTEKDSLREY